MLVEFACQVLQAQVEEVIKEYNEAMEQGEARMGRLKMVVMNEAKTVIAALEDAEAKRQEELGRKMKEPEISEKHFSTLETRTRISRIQSRTSRREREFLSPNLVHRDENENNFLQSQASIRY